MQRKMERCFEIAGERNNVLSKQQQTAAGGNVFSLSVTWSTLQQVKWELSHTSFWKFRLESQNQISEFPVSTFHTRSSRWRGPSRSPGPAARAARRRGVSNSGVLSVQFSWLSLPFTVVFWCSFFILFLVWHCRVGIFYCLGCSPSCIICKSWSPFLCPLFLGKYCVVG